MVNTPKFPPSTKAAIASCVISVIASIASASTTVFYGIYGRHVDAQDKVIQSFVGQARGLEGSLYRFSAPVFEGEAKPDDKARAAILDNIASQVASLAALDQIVDASDSDLVNDYTSELMKLRATVVNTQGRNLRPIYTDAEQVYSGRELLIGALKGKGNI